MSTKPTADAVVVDPVHAPSETPWGSPLAARPGWRPVAGDSAVWDG